MNTVLNKIRQVLTPKTKYLDKDGYELPSNVPIAPPVGYVKQPTLTEQIRAMVQAEHLRRDLDRAGFETFEESNDFEVDDDLDNAKSSYEVDQGDLAINMLQAGPPASPSAVPVPPKAPEPAPEAVSSPPKAPVAKPE